MYHTQIYPHLLHFKQPAGTSRGVYNTRRVWYVVITSDKRPGSWGVGECAPLPDLSCDALPDYTTILSKACEALEKEGSLDIEALRPYPSILFGLETALRHLERGDFALWDTGFSRGEEGIPINGLIWMGDYSTMLQQIESKMASGFRCIKLKIGAIRFEEELSLIRHIRKHFSVKDIELRVDANGAFKPKEAIDKLSRLAEYDIHSIEQPIRAGQWEEMACLAANTPLPIALDEELIGINQPQEKQKLLTTIQPQYIILKPSLHGGFAGSDEWINKAQKMNIGWWITSALESNIGLNTIAQWCATLSNPLPHGLGTGQLFEEEDNIYLPLSIQKDCLWYNPTDRQPDSYSEENIIPSERKLNSSRKETKICIEGKFYSSENLHELIPGKANEHNAIFQDLYTFLSEWFNDSPFITVHTSGSTGAPKDITVRKEQMRQSALMTCSFLGLQKGDTALLCLPLHYIAGKMMVVRALVCELNLIVQYPSGHPLKDFKASKDLKESISLAAMTPMQIYNTLQAPEEAEQLSSISNLLIGGGFIPAELEKEIKNRPNSIYATYGMAETLSHIALRRLNGSDASLYYTPFPSVHISLSEENTLIIQAPLVTEQILTTNDIAEIKEDGCFRILGRKDNVINSGGIKIQIEEVEELLHSIIPVNFVITSIPHPKYGEAIVLLANRVEGLEEIIKKKLTSYQRPKYIWKVKDIPLTRTGKIDRTACKQLAFTLWKESI